MSFAKSGVCSRALIVAVLAASSATVPAVAQGAPGWTFAMKMNVDSGAGKRSVAMTMRQLRVAGKTRMEFSTPEFVGTNMDGMYTIITSADTTITSVVPGMQTATVMNVGGMMMGMDMPHVKSGAEHLTADSLEDLGETETVLGQPTHHYRESRVGTLDIAMGSEMCVQHFNTVTEEWLALDPDLAAALSMDPAAIAGSPFQAFAPDLSTSTSKMPKGMPLRTRATTTSRAGTGAPRIVTNEMEVTELSQGEIADSLFAVPAGFKTLDMRKLLADMPSGMMDSAMQSAMQTGMQSAMELQMKTLCGPGTY